MKHVYIAHPLNAPTREGIEQTPENRELGLQIDEAQVELCSEIWLCGGRISSGMQREIDKAIARGVKVVDLTHFGALPPEEDVAEWLEAWRAAA